MRVYVAGCGGMLGEAVHRVFTDANDQLACTDIDLNADWLQSCDFRDYAAYSRPVEQFGPELLVHLGAHTDLEYCEKNPDDAYATNSTSVQHAARIAQAHHVPLVHISTAGIFDGAKEVYDEDESPNPLGVYAKSKLLGEETAQGLSRHFV